MYRHDKARPSSRAFTLQARFTGVADVLLNLVVIGLRLARIAGWEMVCYANIDQHRLQTVGNPRA